MLSPGRRGQNNPGRHRELRVAIETVGHRGRVIYDSIAGPNGLTAWRGLAVVRRDLVLALGACGVLAYNWWLLVPLRPGLMSSPNELFSNLEVAGHPFATLMQRADLLSGLAMLAAFAIAGTKLVKAGHSDWICMIIFSLAGVAGGLFPETCADAISSSCRAMEVGLRLPATQYLHLAASVVEFGGITAALAFAVFRTWRQRTAIAKTYRRLAVAAVATYPLLGLAYLSDQLGAIIEGLFFLGFTIMVVAELIERTRIGAPAPQSS